MNNFCNFCGSHTHTSITCGIENKMAPYFKSEVGLRMEEYITENVVCQYCNKHTLKALLDFSPSLDLVCTNCNAIYEVKSKCLSIKELPNDIFCNSGNYNEFIKNISNGLNLFVVIYGVDRKKKDIIIRNVYYASNSVLKNKEFVKIEKKKDNTLSTIRIFNKEKLQKIDFTETRISFQCLYNSLFHEIKNPIVYNI